MNVLLECIVVSVDDSLVVVARDLLYLALQLTTMSVDVYACKILSYICIVYFIR